MIWNLQKQARLQSEIPQKAVLDFIDMQNKYIIWNLRIQTRLQRERPQKAGKKQTRGRPQKGFHRYAK